MAANCSTPQSCWQSDIPQQQELCLNTLGSRLRSLKRAAVQGIRGELAQLAAERHEHPPEAGSRSLQYTAETQTASQQQEALPDAADEAAGEPAGALPRGSSVSSHQPHPFGGKPNYVMSVLHNMGGGELPGPL